MVKSHIAANTSLICSLTNPFCKAAKGAKYLDESSVASMPYQMHARATVTTNAAGNGGIVICPGFLFQYFKDSTVTTPGVLSATAFQASLGGTGLAPALYRIVSMGIILRSVASLMTATGMCRIRGYIGEGNQIAVCNATSYNNVTFSQDIPLNALKETCVVNKPSSAAFKNFIQLWATNATGSQNIVDYTNPGWCDISIYLEGGPASSSPIDVEFFINYELAFSESDALGLLATPSKGSNVPITNAAAKLNAKAESIFTQGVQAVENYVWNSALNLATDLVSDLVGGRPRGVDSLDISRIQIVD